MIKAAIKKSVLPALAVWAVLLPAFSEEIDCTLPDDWEGRLPIIVPRHPILWDYMSFERFIKRRFPVGTDPAKLGKWLKQNGFGAPRPWFSSGISGDAKIFDDHERRLATDTVLCGAGREFSTICGRSTFLVNWRIGPDGTIAEILTDSERCYFELP